MFFGKKPAPPANGGTAAAAAAPATQAPTQSAAPAAPAASQPQGGGGALSADEVKKRAIAAKQVAASFGEIVMLLMRSPTEKYHSLQDLEWLIAPALVRGQFALADAQSKETGVVMPVGAVLWALVSADVDKRLTEKTGEPIRLHPDEWRSGDIPWIILTAGDPKVVGGLLQQMTKSMFKDKPAKIRVKGQDGKVVVGRLEVSPESTIQT
jgi:cytolysin-activating lysine-acyltransferase